MADGPDGAFGFALALSADGTRALIGAPSDLTAGGSASGSARVFVRADGVWSEEGVLRPADTGLRGFGLAVALSADGTRALVSASGVRDTIAPTVHVFAQLGTTWSEEATLVRGDGGLDAGFGWSLELSADGTRALIGATGDLAIDLPGSVRVYTRSGSTWSLESTFWAPDGWVSFGGDVALSADGTRAVIGGGEVAYVLARSGATWSEEAMLEPPPYSETSAAETVALSADGTHAVVEASGSRSRMDAYTREGTTWSRDPTYPEWARGSVLSGDGTRAISATNDGIVFMRIGTDWSELAALRADGAREIALSADGMRALVGVRGSDASSGRVYAFTLEP